MDAISPTHSSSLTEGGGKERRHVRYNFRNRSRHSVLSPYGAGSKFNPPITRLTPWAAIVPLNALPSLDKTANGELCSTSSHLLITLILDVAGSPRPSIMRKGGC